MNYVRIGGKLVDTPNIMTRKRDGMETRIVTMRLLCLSGDNVRREVNACILDQELAKRVEAELGFGRRIVKGETIRGRGHIATVCGEQTMVLYDVRVCRQKEGGGGVVEVPV